MAMRPPVMMQDEERGEFDGKPLFVLHVIPHVQDHLKYIVGTPVDRNTADDLKKYHRVINDHAENLRNVENWARSVEAAKGKGGQSSAVTISDLAYEYDKLIGDANADVETLKKMTASKKVKLLLVPADFSVTRWTVLSKKPKGTLKPEPGDYDFVINRIKKIGEWNQAETSSAINKVRAALEGAKAHPRAR